MQRAVLNDIRSLALEDADVPECPPGGLRLRVKACGVCATDVKIYNYGHRLLQLPRVLGHELAGEIDAVGPMLEGRFSLGQRVAVCAAITCGECRSCLNGYPNMCENLQAYGYHHDGGFQEYMAIPPRSVHCGGVHPMPESISFEEAAIAELLACSINGQRLSDFRFGQTALVLGAGPVGILHALLAHARGCRQVTVADIVPAKLDQAKQIGGDAIDAVLDSSDTKALIAQCRALTHGQGFDQVMICCSAAGAQQAAMDIVAIQGCVNLFGGLPRGKSEVVIDTNQIHYKQCRVVGTHGSLGVDNREAVRLIADRTIDVRPLITDRIGLTELEPALIAGSSGDGLKSVVVF